jgi:glutaredoxin
MPTKAAYTVRVFTFFIQSLVHQLRNMQRVSRVVIPGKSASYSDMGAAGRDPESTPPPLDAGLRRYLVIILALAILSVGAAQTNTAATKQNDDRRLEVFTREGCPRCIAAKNFLDQLQQEQPGLQIIMHDIGRDQDALRRLKALTTQRGITVVGVPTFLIGEELIVGFASAETTGARLRALVQRQPFPPPNGVTEETCSPELEKPCVRAEGTKADPDDTVAVPLLGRVSATTLGLPLFTIVLGLLDGFNPCAMWMLLFLLSLLVNLKDRTKMFVIGGTFVLVSGAVYFAFMAAWLNLFLLIGLSRVTQLLLGVIALGVGMINVKDFFAFGRGFSLAIPVATKPGLYAQARRILQAENMASALMSVVVLAVLVNSVELLCTAGLPAVYTQVLVLRQLPWWEYYAYLALYNIAYMFDDSLMLMVAVVTLSRHKLQERGGRWLKLVSGLVMLGLGGVLVLKPSWLLALS